jgi:hypothetical protein
MLMYDRLNYGYNYLLRCSFIASTEVVLSDCVVGNGLKFSLGNVTSSIAWEGGGRNGVGTVS